MKKLFYRLVYVASFTAFHMLIYRQLNFGPRNLPKQLQGKYHFDKGLQYFYRFCKYSIRKSWSECGNGKKYRYENGQQWGPGVFDWKFKQKGDE